jgi:D-alanyl-D-alanine carboxypeptidase (penicillin-binding protein 5/6)
MLTVSIAYDLDPEPGIGAPTPPPVEAPRRRHRGYAVVATLSVVVFVVLAYVATAAVRPLPAAAAVVPTQAVQSITTQAVDPAWPSQGSAAVGLVGQSGLLGSHGQTDAMVPIASMTKTITALVLLDQHKLTAGQQGPTITFSNSDVDILRQVWSEGGSWAPVQAGEKLTLVQALTAMLLPSANNYARSLAVWSSGSQPAFVAAANAWLKQHGFTHTHMTDPSGFDSGSVSSMGDLVGIGKLAVSDPVLSKVVNTTHASLPGVGDIDNTNKLIGQDGIEGVKTGYTQQAGHCLLFAATVTLNGQKRTLVGVMLGQPQYEDLWTGAPKLLKSFEDAFHSIDLTNAGQTVYATYRTPWGATTQLVAATTPKLEIYSAGTVTVKVTADALGEVASKAKAGTVTFDYDGKTIVAKLRTTAALTAPALWWRLTHPTEVFLASADGR